MCMPVTAPELREYDGIYINNHDEYSVAETRHLGGIWYKQL